MTMKTQQNIAANSHNNITKYQTVLINYNKGKGEEEFRRITTIQLESTFMEKLDCYMPRLLSLFKKKGGAAGVKLQGIQEMLYGVCAHDITVQLYFVPFLQLVVNKM